MERVGGGGRGWRRKEKTQGDMKRKECIGREKKKEEAHIIRKNGEKEESRI